MKKNLIMALVSLMFVMTISVIAVNSSNVNVFATNNKLQEEKSNLEVISEDDFRVKELRENGILIGDEKGNLQLGETLKRQEMVVLISRLMGKESEAKKWDTSKLTFEDVEKENWAAGYIAWAKDNNITKGYSEEQFGYNDSLTEVQTAIFLLRVLGYDAEMDNVDELAFDSAGIVIESRNLENNPIIRGNVAKMLYNTLYATMYDENILLAEKLNIKTAYSNEERNIAIELEKYGMEYINIIKSGDWLVIYINEKDNKINKNSILDNIELYREIANCLNNKLCAIVDTNNNKIQIVSYENASIVYQIMLNGEVIFNYNEFIKNIKG